MLWCPPGIPTVGPRCAASRTAAVFPSASRGSIQPDFLPDLLCTDRLMVLHQNMQLSALNRPDQGNQPPLLRRENFFGCSVHTTSRCPMGRGRPPAPWVKRSEGTWIPAVIRGIALRLSLRWVAAGKERNGCNSTKPLQPFFCTPKEAIAPSTRRAWLSHA